MAPLYISQFDFPSTKMARLPISFPTCAAALAGFILSSCHTLETPPTASASPAPVAPPVDQVVDTQSEKSFKLRHDWAHGAWVIKRGANITFRSDGTGHFGAVIFSRQPTGFDEVRFQSIQYGRDGNVLFAFPDNPVGYPLHVRRPAKDYPYNANFGFDPRHFDSINHVNFFARMRIHGVDGSHMPAQKGK